MPPSPPPPLKQTPSVTDGLVGLYTGEQWTGTQWLDTSGNGNHLVTFGGTVTVKSVGLNSRTFISGTTSSALIWPVGILPPTYTLFHVAKYNSGTKGRIFNGYNADSNWLSGFWNGLTGVAFHEGWLTSSQIDCCGFNWVLSTDQNGLYRANGVQKSTNSGGSASNRLAVNTGGKHGGETSDWAIAAVVVYNRTLSATEIMSMENWLSQLYGFTATISAPFPPPTPPSPPPPPFYYAGCYRDCALGGRALSKNLFWPFPMTAQICAGLAREGGYTVFGTQYGAGE